jgi:2-desacetyl-2-hydroxyethyl bacteriochlorophyllide A dehydrogenase
MKTLSLIAPKELIVKQIAIPEPKANEVRIKIIATGICGSDVHLYQGDRKIHFPMVIGHESWGFIDKVGTNITHFTIGQRVVVEPNILCGVCRFCTSGRGNICINKKVVGVTIDGCFAEYISLDASYVWSIPDSMNDHDAVTIEPLAVVVHALKQIGNTNKKIAVVGLGAIGLLLTELALIEGYEVYVKDLHDSKVALAKSKGALVLPTEEQALQQFLIEKEVEAIFDCAGHHEALNQILRVVPRGAKIVMVGISSESVQFVPLQIAREGVSILPSIIYDHPADFNKAIELITSNIVHPGWIVEQTFNFAEYQIAFDQAVSGKYAKLVLQMGSPSSL